MTHRKRPLDAFLEAANAENGSLGLHPTLPSVGQGQTSLWTDPRELARGRRQDAGPEAGKKLQVMSPKVTSNSRTPEMASTSACQEIETMSARRQTEEQPLEVDAEIFITLKREIKNEVKKEVMAECLGHLKSCQQMTVAEMDNSNLELTRHMGQHMMAPVSA